MKKVAIIGYAMLGAIAVAAGWYASIDSSTAASATDMPEYSEGSGPLDGMTFKAMLGPDGKPKDVPDVFVFENGTFISKECELRCEYPASPYFIREVGEKISFISETRCPYKDAKIIWRGTISNGEVSGVASWTMKRWYWTIEQDYEFSGTLAESGAPLASSE